MQFTMRSMLIILVLLLMGLGSIVGPPTWRHYREDYARIKVNRERAKLDKAMAEEAAEWQRIAERDSARARDMGVNASATPYEKSP